jgi:hypothetical protein
MWMFQPSVAQTTPQHLWMVDEAGERRLEADEAERVQSQNAVAV